MAMTRAANQEYQRGWRRRNLEKCRAYARRSVNKSNYNAKSEVLTKYGAGGQLRCSWDGCQITDIDMLSLDHIHNDGAAERKNGRGGGQKLYQALRREHYPSGYQTLCHNHQWKKQLLRVKACRKDK